ncbi:MAG: cytidine deaminase [Candidatus Dormibacteria bacterium]
MTTEVDIDWRELRTRARAAARNAYAPYSKLHVGAAGLTDQGRVETGCNVENASFGLSLCAECGLVSALHASGAHRLLAIAVVTDDGLPLSPCGRCRQLLLEQGGPELSVDRGEGLAPVPISQLLPGAFDAAELSSRQG